MLFDSEIIIFLNSKSKPKSCGHHPLARLRQQNPKPGRFQLLWVWKSQWPVEVRPYLRPLLIYQNHQWSLLIYQNHQWFEFLFPVMFGQACAPGFHHMLLKRRDRTCHQGQSSLRGSRSLPPPWVPTCRPRWWNPLVVGNIYGLFFQKYWETTNQFIANHPNTHHFFRETSNQMKISTFRFHFADLRAGWLCRYCEPQRFCCP